MRSRESMTELRFVLVDFRYTNDVVGHIRLYEAGCTYLSLPKTPSGGVTAATESKHDCG
jgi:hypothetical protein